MDQPLRLLCVFAHPDDESMAMGGTLAKYAAEGVETYLVCASRGEAGWFGPQEQDPGPERLGQLRESELLAAGEKLGLKEIHFLNYIDGQVDKADPIEVINKIVSHIRRIKPQVVVTFPPDGGYGHPDHIASAQFAAAAIVAAADSHYIDLEQLPAHRVLKYYYMVDSENFVNFITPIIGNMSFQVGDEMRSEVAWKEWAITTRIDVSAFSRTAWEAIKCHNSQLPSLGPLAEMDADSAASVLNLQGTFYRAFSLVNGGRKIETDLFEGLK